jgi:hypothetical protein
MRIEAVFLQERERYFFNYFHGMIAHWSLQHGILCPLQA